MKPLSSCLLSHIALSLFQVLVFSHSEPQSQTDAGVSVPYGTAVPPLKPTPLQAQQNVQAPNEERKHNVRGA